MLPWGGTRGSVTSSRALLLSQWRGPSVHRGLAPSPPPSLALPAPCPTLGSPQVTKLYKVLAWNPTLLFSADWWALLGTPGPQDPCFSLGL